MFGFSRKKSPSAHSTAVAGPHVTILSEQHQKPQAMAYLERGGEHLHGPLGFGGWHVSPTGGATVRTSDQDLRRDWEAVTAYARSLIQNSGQLAGCVEQTVTYAVGRGLVPSIHPDADALGWSAAQAREWSRRLEVAYLEWADDPLSADSRGIHTFGTLQGAALRGWFGTGDIIAVLDFGAKRAAPYKTAVNLIDPARLRTPPAWAQPQYSKLVGGVEFDERGRATAYHFTADPSSMTNQPVRVAVLGSNDRRLVLHAYHGEPGTIRGISPFASVISACAQMTSLHDAMLVAAHASAELIGTVTSDLPTGSVAQGLGGQPGQAVADQMADRIAWHSALASKGAHITLGPKGRIAHLQTGEKFELHAGKHAFAHYPDMLKAELREIAAAAQVPYELVGQDRSQATYSSLRVALADFNAANAYRRATLVEPLCDWAIEGLAEELIDGGKLPFTLNGHATPLDSFRAHKRKALKVTWAGGTTASADTLKDVKASILKLRFGLSTFANEISTTSGMDAETVQQRLAAELAAASALGLRLPVLMPPNQRGDGGSM